MTQEHPITPPPELVLQWIGEFFGCTAGGELSDSERFLATQAARWGADQELEACCEWFVHDWTDIETADTLRAARRPKPPSLKGQALAAWDRLRNEAWCEEIDLDLDFVLRALESLPD
jgi:hypothetical protein